MGSREDLLASLRTLEEEMHTEDRAREIGLFGSANREERTEGSDIDILVDFEDHADLLDLTGLALFLEEKLFRTVDVVSKKSLRDEIKEPVMKEVTPVWEIIGST